MLLFFAPQMVSAATIAEGTGFIQKNIWYSKYPLVEGEKVKIYTLINNPSTSTLAGTATFYDKDSVIASKQFSVNAQGYGTVFVEWKATAGDHAIMAKITKAKIGNVETPQVPFNTTGVDQTYVSPRTTTVATTTPIKNNNDATALEKFIVEKTPLDTWYEGVDDFRVETARDMGNTISEIKDEIGQSKKVSNDTSPASTVSSGYITKDTSSALKTPWNYIQLFFWQTAHFIFANKPVFFGLCILILVLIIRKIIQSLF